MDGGDDHSESLEYPSISGCVLTVAIIVVGGHQRHEYSYSGGLVALGLRSRPTIYTLDSQPASQLRRN